MIIEQVARITDWVQDTFRTRVYTTMVDPQGKTHVSCAVYNYTPYDRHAQLERDLPRGSQVDQKA